MFINTNDAKLLYAVGMGGIETAIEEISNL